SLQACRLGPCVLLQDPRQNPDQTNMEPLFFKCDSPVQPPRRLGGGSGPRRRSGARRGAMSRPSPSPLSWFLLVVLGLTWGGSFLSIAKALTGFEPLTIAAGRIVIAAAILTATA